MSNKKSKPAAGKSAAGKSDYKKKMPTSERDKKRISKRASEEKEAKRLLDEKHKKQREREKRSVAIQKNRAKAAETERKNQKKADEKQRRQVKRKGLLSLLSRIWDKIKYYTGKEFLDSFNYVRIFIFIVLPIVLLFAGGIGISRSVTVNVPAEIRKYEFNGRLESESAATDSVFNAQQKRVLIKSLKSVGSKNFEFYINSDIPIGDDMRTDELCFGNPQDGVVLIATIFDSNGEIIYRSLGLGANKEINRAVMFEELSYGTHEVKVCVNAYDEESGEKIGARYAEIRLIVGGN